MRLSRVLVVVGFFLFMAGNLLGQTPAKKSSMIVLPADVSIFGPEQQNFNQSMKDVLFAFDDCECPENDVTLSENVEWLKAHPNVRFYINGYADTRGNTVYNMALAQRRANAVKAALIKMGIPKERILVAAGWGEMFGACTDDTDVCHTRNRRVRLLFATAQPDIVTSPK